MTLSIIRDGGAHPTLIREFQYELVWKPELQYIASTQVELRATGPGCYRWANPATSWTYLASSTGEGDVTYRWEPDTSSVDGVVMRFTLPCGVRRGQQVPLRLTVRPCVWLSPGMRLAIWTLPPPKPGREEAAQPSAEPEPGSECLLVERTGPVERLSIYAHPAANASGQTRVALVPEDRYGNPASFQIAVPVTLEWQGQQRVESIEGPVHVLLDAPATLARPQARVPMDALALDENVANGRRVQGDLVVTGNPVHPADETGLRPAFGAIHWHTTISDGWDSADSTLAKARDLLNLDFGIPEDHAPMDEWWQKVVDSSERNYAPGEFVTLFAGEAGSGRGHTGILSAQADWPGREAPDFWLRDPAVIASSLSEREDLIVIANHPAVNGVPHWDRYAWGKPHHALRLVEMIAWGNQEQNGYPDVWRGWYQHSHASVQDALAMGHKVGFIGSSDNHPGWPGRMYHAKSQGLHSPKSIILTGVWTRSLDRRNLFEAFHARRTWAVWDMRAIPWFAINNTFMGGELAVAQGQELVAHIRLTAEDALQSVEIISDGQAVWGSSFASPDVEVEVSLGIATRSTHFYLRALQRDGGMLYASPVFVNISNK